MMQLQQDRFMMFSLNMIDYTMSFLDLIFHAGQLERTILRNF